MANNNVLQKFAWNKLKLGDNVGNREKCQDAYCLVIQVKEIVTSCMYKSTIFHGC